MPNAKVARVAKVTPPKDMITNQDVIELYLREESRIAGCSPEDTERMIAEFRKTNSGKFNDPPRPELLAMLEAELRESEAFVKNLAQHQQKHSL